MKHLTLLFAVSIGTILVFTACKNRQKDESDYKGFRYNDEMAKSKMEVTKSFIYAFPSPGDLLQRFDESELTYNEELMNSPDSGKNYITSKDKALNLGIYITDMAYAAKFSRSSEALKYLDIIQSLSEDISISTSAFESLIKRAKSNIGDNDSLLAISNDLFFQMVEFLENSGKENTIALVSSGAYIESMHIAFQSVDQYSEDSKIIKQIVELKYPLKNLLDHAETVSDDPNVLSILKYIRELNRIFDELETEAGGSEVINDEPGVISLMGGSDDKMNEEDFKALRAKIEEIRNFIINI